MNMDEMEEVVRRAQGGDAEAIEYIIDKCSRYAKFYARKFIISGMDYDDMYQECLIGIYTAIQYYRESVGCKFMTFAIRCIKTNIYRKHYMATMQKHEILNNAICLEDANLIIVDYRIPEKIVIEKETIDEILNSLSGLQSSVIRLRVSGFSLKEIAAKMHVSIGVVSHAIRKARGNATQAIRRTRENVVVIPNENTKENIIDKGEIARSANSLGNVNTTIQNKKILVDKIMIDEVSEHLTELEYSVMKLHLASMSYGEIARKLHLSRPQVRSALQRAKNKIVKIQK